MSSKAILKFLPMMLKLAPWEWSYNWIIIMILLFSFVIIWTTLYSEPAIGLQADLIDCSGWV
jgi:hypothetical protein